MLVMKDVIGELKISKTNQPVKKIVEHAVIESGNKRNIEISQRFAENSRTAFWYARNNARVFGETDTPRPSSFPTSKTFKLTAAEIARIRPEKSITIRQGQERSIER